MKTLFIACSCSFALVLGAFAQDPTVTPAVSPAAPSPAVSASAAASASPAASATGASSLADRIHQKIDKKLKHKGGVNFQIGDDEESADSGKSGSHGDSIPKEVIPLVGVIMLIAFGTPTLAMALLLYFGFSKTRMMHRTVRLMVEKGQPVPEALLNPPPHVRKRSDMRRGVILLMIGIGLIVFLGAVNHWEEGSWAFGILPFLIGAGYLLVWKLEGKGHGETKADNPAPLP